MYSLRHLLAAGAALFSVASASERALESSSLQTCMDNSAFTAKLFQVAFTPNNNTLAINVDGTSGINGNVTAELIVFAYGLNAYSRRINPCEEKGFSGMCPMNTGRLQIDTSWQLGDKDVKQVPGIAYTFPDIDVKVQILVNRTNSDVTVACIQAELTNGKSVYQKAVGWITAIIAGIGLMASAITSGLGHSNTAAHVAANALSLFGYFQSQAFIAMMAVPLPPIVASWTQNFVWTMGIIRVGFLQDMATWYQRATGGTPSTVVSNSQNESVTVTKRSLQVISRAFRALAARAASGDSSGSQITVRGIERVGFRANIELTNIFFTGYTFFVIFFLFVVIGVVLFKYIIEALVRADKLKSDQFLDFRNGWKTVLKGILFRIVLISFPQVVVLCFWELTVRDSAAEVVLAVVTIIMEIGILAWASLKVWRMAQRSLGMHKNPAYILYSDPVALNKWGFLYVQFRAAAYYFIVPVLCYTLIKGLFIAFAQSHGTVQAVALVIIEAAFLVLVCVMRPYMDKKTNGFNISIAAINFLCAIFLLVFSDVFNQPVSTSYPHHCEVQALTRIKGHRHRRHGRHLLHLQRRLRPDPAAHGPHRIHLRACVQEPRHAVPANARRPRLVHQVADDAQRGRRARRPGRHRPRRRQEQQPRLGGQPGLRARQGPAHRHRRRRQQLREPAARRRDREPPQQRGAGTHHAQPARVLQ